MRTVSKIALGLAALLAMGGTAMAADLMAPPPPAAAMTSGWDGMYIGANGNYDLDSYVGFQGVVGFNATVSDSFLVGGELAVGPYFGVGSQQGDNGFEDYLAARAGFVTGSAVIYGLAGITDVDDEIGSAFGAGVEFMVSDNVSLRVQALDYLHPDFSPYFQQVGVGLMFHFK